LARPREAGRCRTLICRKADSGQLNDLATIRTLSRQPSKSESVVKDFRRYRIVMLFAGLHAPPQLVEEVFEEDHVALRLLRLRREVGGGPEQIPAIGVISGPARIK
jgi:hypothetical protein